MDPKEAEARLRERITRVLSLASGVDLTETPERASAIEDQVLELFRSYIEAPPAQKEEVYKAGEERLLRKLRGGTTRAVARSR